MYVNVDQCRPNEEWFVSSQPTRPPTCPPPWFLTFPPSVPRNPIDGWDFIWAAAVIRQPTMATTVVWIRRFLRHLVASSILYNFFSNVCCMSIVLFKKIYIIMINKVWIVLCDWCKYIKDIKSFWTQLINIDCSYISTLIKFLFKIKILFWRQ